MRATLLCSALTILLASCSGHQAPDAATSPIAAPGDPIPAGELVVYTSRNEQLVKPLFDRYTAETGVAITYLTDKAPPLMERLRAEGSRTPADVFITVDAGNLWQATNLDLLQPVDSAVLQANIPENLRDPENRWFGLSVRARTMVHNPAVTPVSSLSSYEDLADPKWRGKVCLRTSSSVYNQSLVATMIARLGAQRSEQIVKGWVQNLAAPAFANDTAVIEAVAAGRCAVGIVNSYYLGRALRDDADLPVTVFWANQGNAGGDASGVHVDISGAGITAHSDNVDGARAFIEWLSAGEAQGLYANENLEYPANPAVAAAPIVQAWGDYRQNLINVTESGKLQTEAVKLMDRAGYH